MFAIVLLLAQLATSTAQSAPARSLIQSRSDGSRQPIFIASSRLVQADGEFSSEMPPSWRGLQDQYRHSIDSAKARVRSTSAVASLPCGGVYLGEDDVESLVVRDTARTTVANAKAIFVGRVKQVTPGLFFGSPGSLLEVSDLDVIKESPAYANVQGSVFVRHPYAHFSLGTIEYCRATAGLHPDVGDQVMVFAFDDPADDDGTLVLSHESDIVFEKRGQVLVPSLLHVIAPSTASFPEIVGNVRGMAHDLRAKPGNPRSYPFQTAPS